MISKIIIVSFIFLVSCGNRSSYLNYNRQNYRGCFINCVENNPESNNEVLEDNEYYTLYGNDFSEKPKTSIKDTTYEPFVTIPFSPEDEEEYYEY